MKIDLEFSENHILNYLIFTCQLYQYISVTIIRMYTMAVCANTFLNINRLVTCYNFFDNYIGI